MSEEKLYAVKNDEGKWLCIEANGCHYWSRDDGDFFDQHDADILAHVYGGHVVELIEKPNPEVVSKAEAKMLDKAKTASYPANYISMHAHPDPGANGTSYDELRLMRALVNDYTVAKEKKYRVKVPETQTSYYYKGSDGHVHASDTSGGLDNEFSYSELQQYGLDGERFTKEEVTDDGMGC
ncbi:hypothetical protein FAM7821_01159 [Lacticaseibacillus paracasei]|uniref:DUF1642 domain-containing protein n=1 Tax=Lacticaseibacillus paracasei TaxID=1597 RepID=UPI000FF17CD4|nr:DUF1642 domain-containing protein [Lacticaseibacillus paracasei]RNE38823.1 hypothetical protein FAM7821_01159 [Lacticaseibacillus paracasei]